jgi:hypothetical protein
MFEHLPTEIQGYCQQIWEFPHTLEHTVEKLPEQWLEACYRPGSWTIRQIIHHLADAQMHAFIRMNLILTEEYPVLRPFKHDEWADLAESSQGPIAPSLEIIRGVHKRWAYALNTLQASDFQKKAWHPDRGLLDLHDIVRIYAGHGPHHLEQIRTAIRTME